MTLNSESSIQSGESYGELIPSQHDVTNPNHIFKETGYKTYNVALDPNIDKIYCDIWGVCELPDGEIVIADKSNQRVKLLDKEYKLVFSCLVPKYPLDVCHIGENKVVVCISHGNSNGMQFINIANKELVTTETINFTHACTAIASHGDMLYVCSGSALYVYTKSAQLVKKLYEDKSGDISTDGEVVYITDPQKAQIICIDRSGNTLSTFTNPDMRNPTGIHVTPAGHVFVCSWTDNLILQIDKDGNRKLATLYGNKEQLIAPKALFFSSRTSGLIVGGYSNSLLDISLQ